MRKTFNVEPWTGMKVDVFDTGDAWMALAYEVVVHAHTDHLIEMQDVSNGICQMVDNVVNAVSLSGGLSLLRLWGHGDPGMQNITSDRNVKGYNNNNALLFLNIEENAWYLQRLTPLFAADGIIEFHGCSVGQGPEGESFLKQVAYAVKVPVVGSAINQGGPGSRISAANGIGWEGDGWVTMAFPDGTIVYGPGSGL